MTWTLHLRPAARRALDALDKKTLARVEAMLARLAEDPKANASKLTNRPEWRVRVGDFRILFEIHEAEVVVLVLTIAHRREVYR